MRESVKRLLAATSSFLATKVELIGIELQEEKRNLVEILIFATLTIFFGVVALTVVSCIIISMLWGDYTALAVVSLVYALIALGSGLMLRRKLNQASLSFEATVEELKKDTEWVRRHL